MSNLENKEYHDTPNTKTELVGLQKEILKSKPLEQYLIKKLPQYASEIKKAPIFADKKYKIITPKGLQKVLSILGYNPGVIDGKRGKNTKKAFVFYLNSLKKLTNKTQTIVEYKKFPNTNNVFKSSQPNNKKIEKTTTNKEMKQNGTLHIEYYDQTISRKLKENNKYTISIDGVRFDDIDQVNNNGRIVKGGIQYNIIRAHNECSNRLIPIPDYLKTLLLIPGEGDEVGFVSSINNEEYGRNGKTRGRGGTTELGEGYFLPKNGRQYHKYLDGKL